MLGVHFQNVGIMYLINFQTFPVSICERKTHLTKYFYAYCIFENWKILINAKYQTNMSVSKY